MIWDDDLNEPIWEFEIDFHVGDRVYADCNGMSIAGNLVAVRGEKAFVDFGGTYGVIQSPLNSVSPYDTT